MLSAEGELTVTDLDSANGTHVCGRKIEGGKAERVLSGDTIVLGSSVLVAKIEGADDDSRNRLARIRREDEAVLALVDFEIVGALGEGSFGRVYAARQPFVQRIVAVKIMRDRVEKTNPAWERFLREGQVCCRLDSPFIVQVYTIRLSGERIYLVMELVNGPSAKDQLRSGPFVLREALRVAIDIARGLMVVHEAGIIHRDVKPSNILLCPSGVAKLGDFGCAKDVHSDDALTESNFGMGSLPYVSPEQATDARSVDDRADVYGLGATLYHFLAGRPPFRPNSPAILMRVVEEAPEQLDSFRPDCPTELVRLVHGMLEKDPNLRPPSASSVLRQLEEIRELHCPVLEVPAMMRQPSRCETARLPKGFYKGGSGVHRAPED